MKIAVTAPPWISIPPHGYGGTERVVHNLVEGLIQKGHSVKLYATGDSKTSAELLYYYKKALGNNLNHKLNPFYILNHIYNFYKNIPRDVDIIHDNSSDMMLSLYFSSMTTTPCIYTIHGVYSDTVQDLFAQYGITASTKEALLQFKDKPFVSISNKQRDYIPELHYVKTVYNSIILSHYTFEPTGGDYIAWLGRVNFTKGVDTVIKTAHSVGRKLKIAAFIDAGDQSYFDSMVRPLLTSSTELTHEISPGEKSHFMGDAKLFLFPIRWDEPFGIVMIEAMAAGTPVIAYAMGAAPEVIKDGETGFLVNPSDKDIRGDYIIKKTGFDGLCEAVERIYGLSATEYSSLRKACRAHVEKHFTVDTMVDDYLKAYDIVLSSKK